MTDITELALLVSKAKASVFTLEYISQFEPADIDSDDVDLRFEVDGRDTGTNVSIVDECGQAAKVIGTLVEALEAKDARISGMKAERDEFRRRPNLDRDILADADKRIAELQESNAQVIHSRDHYKHISEELMRRIHELQSRAEAAEKCLSNLAAVSRRYLPDYDEHPEIQAADDLLKQNSLVTAGIQIHGGE